MRTIILFLISILNVTSSLNLEEFRSKELSTWGGLYPRESPSRDVRTLDGIWDFRLAPMHDPDQGFREEWYKEPLKLNGSIEKIPVPSSYNDVTESRDLRDHIGWAWYDREFYVPKSWITKEQRIVLRIGAAHYNSITYINGYEVVRHEGGHLPIMAEISKYVESGKKNLLTICINNTLTPETLPQGEIIHKDDLKKYPAGYFTQKLNFDFFNYAGIHRPVYLYSTPKTYIDDILINTGIDGTTGLIQYNVTTKSDSGSLKGVGCSVKVYDQMDNHIKSAIGCIAEIAIENANFWWPYLMDQNPAYMYTLHVTVVDSLGNLDEYPQKVGIRTLGWNSTTVTLNKKPLYLTGFGRHEDYNIRGRGFDYGTMVKDFSLLKWVGANSFRTSHYPYAEEIMDMADQEGIMIIDESPAIGLTGFNEELLNLHISVMEELIGRDKNRPSVIMWSVGNEPKSAEIPAGPYFGNISEATRNFDGSRPVTCVVSVALESDLAAKSFDTILINRYYSWYQDTGHLELIYRQTIHEVSSWHFAHNKPVLMSEYGAGSISGTHIGPSFTWSEEYQVDLMLENFKAFDDLRRMGFFFGEMIWNFADFATPQETNRPPGCMKGIFTRDRQPKMAAQAARWRYWSVANTLYNMPYPGSNCSLQNFKSVSDDTDSNRYSINDIYSGLLEYLYPF